MNNPFPPKSIIKDSLQPPNLFYRGSSMKGTFKPGDKLIIEKVPFNQINKGDVIIFRRTHEDDRSDFIVHRVAGITAAGLVTRGDNCLEQDKELAFEKNVIGKVIRYDRQGKIGQVWNGWAGALRAALLQNQMQVIKLTKFFLRKPYQAIKKSGLIAKIWRPKIDVFQFETCDGTLVKYVYKRKTVAIFWAEKNRQWQKQLYDFNLNSK